MTKRLTIVGLAFVGVVALVRWVGGGDAEPSDPELVLDRVWVDQLATKPKDTMNVFIAITQQPLGIFQSTSQWKGTYELFQYTAAGNELRLVYPQTDEKEKVKVRAWKCSQGDMDYCLELTGASRGVKRYKSQRGWEIGGVATPERLREQISAVVGRAK